MVISSQKINSFQFIEKLQLVINKPIWRVIHPADGWLFLDFGRKYLDHLSGTDGKKVPYEKGEIRLYIKGDWTITKNGKTQNCRDVSPNETQKQFFSRMEFIVNNFPITFISRLEFAGGKVSFIDQNGFQLTVDMPATDDSLEFTVTELNDDNVPVAYTHYEFNESKQSLTMTGLREIFSWFSTLFLFQ